MTDVVCNERRSWIMSRVKSADTSPELAVRSMVHRLGYRFRLHRRDLPGAPDLVFPRYKKVVFVHGCFWHGHACPRGGRIPASNRDYWLAKMERNRIRDGENEARLRELGWAVLTVWECELREPEAVSARLVDFLSGSGRPVGA